MSTSTNKDVEEKKLDAIVGKDHSSSSILAVYVQGILFATYYARTRASARARTNHNYAL